VQVEFKRQLPGNSDESKRTVFKTVAAFANGHGGSIVFGVEKDEATVCGLEEADLITARDRLAQLARSIVTPAPDTEVRQYGHDGKTLFVLAVSRGADPPYGITLPGRQNRSAEFYVRRDATTFLARPEEIENAVLAAAPLPEVTAMWGY
jgi:predicted HTH transcriptional regulator